MNHPSPMSDSNSSHKINVASVDMDGEDEQSHDQLRRDIQIQRGRRRSMTGSNHSSGSSGADGGSGAILVKLKPPPGSSGRKSKSPRHGKNSSWRSTSAEQKEGTLLTATESGGQGSVRTPKNLCSVPESGMESSSLQMSPSLRTQKMLQSFQPNIDGMLDDPEDGTRIIGDKSSFKEAALGEFGIPMTVSSSTIQEETAQSEGLTSGGGDKTRNSLASLADLPDYYNARRGRGASSRMHSGHSANNSVTSGVSKLSFASHSTSNSSMPSLSSIVEHDLASVGTNLSGGASVMTHGTNYSGNASVITSGTNYSGDASVLTNGTNGTNGSSVLTGNSAVPSTSSGQKELSPHTGQGSSSHQRPVILSMIPPPSERRLTHSNSHTSGITANSNSTRSGSRTTSQHTRSSSADAGRRRSRRESLNLPPDLYELEGTTLDALGPNFANSHKRTPQSRWESVSSSNTTKKYPPLGPSSSNPASQNTNAKLPGSSSDFTAQMNLLPSKKDIMPMYRRPRRSSDPTSSPDGVKGSATISSAAMSGPSSKKLGDDWKNLLDSFPTETSTQTETFKQQESLSNLFEKSASDFGNVAVGNSSKRNFGRSSSDNDILNLEDLVVDSMERLDHLHLMHRSDASDMALIMSRSDLTFSRSDLAFSVSRNDLAFTPSVPEVPPPPPSTLSSPPSSIITESTPVTSNKISQNWDVTSPTETSDEVYWEYEAPLSPSKGSTPSTTTTKRSGSTRPRSGSYDSKPQRTRSHDSKPQRTRSHDKPRRPRNNAAANAALSPSSSSHSGRSSMARRSDSCNDPPPPGSVLSPSSSSHSGRRSMPRRSSSTSATHTAVSASSHSRRSMPRRSSSTNEAPCASSSHSRRSMPRRSNSCNDPPPGPPVRAPSPPPPLPPPPLPS